MPRNSLRNLGSGAPSAPPALPELPAEVQSLLSERQALETRMAELTGGTVQQGDNRFPVTPLTQRRAEDDAWSQGRDEGRSGRSRPAEPQIARAAGAPADQDPDLAERTGQRALQNRLGRYGEAAIPGLPDRTGQSGPPALRSLENTPLREKVIGLRERVLPNDPAERDFAPEIPVPREPMLRALKDRFSGPAKRLDILNGGSGDLDQLRQTASERMQARRDEERSAERQEARRKAAREDRRREERRNLRRGKYD